MNGDVRYCSFLGTSFLWSLLQKHYRVTSTYLCSSTRYSLFFKYVKSIHAESTLSSLEGCSLHTSLYKGYHQPLFAIQIKQPSYTNETMLVYYSDADWSSKKQLVDARTLDKAEYRVIANAIYEVLSVTSLLTELGVPL